MEPEERPIYRSLHSAPMLGGIPAPYALALVGAAAVGGLVVFMAVDKLLGVVSIGVVLVVWGVLAAVFAQDRVQVPLFWIRLFHRFPARISSFSPSYQRVAILDEG
jgi:hypothetical protein